MELVLNLVGALVAAGLIGLWLRMAAQGRDGRAHWGIQAVALLLLIVILFPVISVTDDLMMAQNPAETDSVQRRNLEASVLHAAAVCAEAPMDALPTAAPQVMRHALARSEGVFVPQAPALAPIENRPPPIA